MVGCRDMTAVAPFFPRPEEVATHGMTVSKRSNEAHGFIQSQGRASAALCDTRETSFPPMSSSKSCDT